VGPAPGAGDPVNRAGTVRLPTREGATNAPELARRFLQAGAAADWDPDRDEDTRVEDAKNFAEQFLTQDQRRDWQPTDVQVVDAQFVENLDSVTVTVTPVGRLEPNGVVGPTRAPPAHMQFQAQLVNGNMMLAVVSGALPNYLMLSLDGLTSLFEERPVYFWDKNNRFLVPDRRYVSRGISDEKRVRAIINLWLAGPSVFLRDAVIGPPAPTTRDNPELNGNVVRVNLPTIGQPADPDDALRRIAWQIRWSVHRPSSALGVDLQVAGRSQYKDTGVEYLKANPSQRAGEGAPDEGRLFAVQDGHVVAVSPDEQSPSILRQPDYNSNVVLAAVNRPNNVAALVRREGGGALALWLGRGGAEPAYTRAAIPGATTMSRPSFIPGTGGRVLIAVDGTLYEVALDGQIRPVPNAPGGVTAVSVAPDGARVALVTAGGPVVAALDATAAWVSIGPTRSLYVTNLPKIGGIGWLYEDRLVMGGESAMVEVAIDNGRVERIAPANLARAQVTELSAVPGSPFEANRGNVVVAAGVDAGAQQAYYAYSSGLVPITLPQVSSPAPSASVGPNSTPPKLSAPFYIDEVK
jgi:hypothetical protein